MPSEHPSQAETRKAMYLAKAREADQYAAKVRDPAEREKWKRIAESWRSLMAQLE